MPSLIDLMPAFGLEGESWAPWCVVAKVLDGAAATFTAEEHALFEQCTGRTRPPDEPPAEFYGIIGRRSGKSRFAGALAARAAGLRRYDLAPGERAIIGLAAADREQARVLLGYARAPFEARAEWRGLVRPPSRWAQLADLVTRTTRWGFDLTTGTTVEVRTSAFGTIRGRTYALVVADELAFWQRDDGSNPASEVLAAVRPGLVTLDGQLVGISSPFAKSGPLWDAFKRYWGQDDERVLVWRAPSRTMNQLIPERVVLDALERDEAAARAEWLAEFRSDVESFISREAIARVVVAGRQELAPRLDEPEAGDYLGFIDAADGAGQDSFTAAVCHVEQEEASASVVGVLDAVREARPSFNPSDVVADFAAFLRGYNLAEAWGDRWARSWVAEAFAVRGISVRPCPQTKSELYRDFLPLVTTGAVELLDHPRLIAQLHGLERRVGASGRDVVDHGRASGQHDDVINAVAGALVLAHAEVGRSSDGPMLVVLRR